MNVNPYARARRVRDLFDPQLAEADPCPPDLADRTLTAIAEAVGLVPEDPVSESLGRVLITSDVLAEVGEERVRQRHAHGEQVHLPDGTGPGVEFLLEGTASQVRDHVRRGVDVWATDGRSQWAPILLEEVFEAFAEDDPARLRAELVQVAAVAVQWIEAIDARAVTHG